MELDFREDEIMSCVVSCVSGPHSHWDYRALQIFVDVVVLSFLC